MPPLGAKERAELPDSAFAYIDSRGRRRLPIHDAAHVRNALARFSQVAFEDEGARDKARMRLLRAAKKHGIMPIGFVSAQLQPQRKLPKGAVTFLLTDIEGSTAPAAVEAALAIQRAMRANAWPGGADVRVRIGVHRGRPTLTDTGYVGLSVHTAARICSAAHGGQIVVSSGVRSAVLTSLADGIGLRSLGTWRFQGLREPEDLYQVEAADLLADFPPLRSVQPGTRS
jgi:Adenylate and Guanylate cyclase catalytic domain